MTRKHYILLAAAIKRQTDKPDAMDRSFHEVAADISEMCKYDNPAFDRQRFMTACGF